MTLFNMIKRSKQRSNPSGRTKSNYGSNSEFKPTKAINIKQNMDKYLGLAREAVATGDTISAERYYQHAEHYLRLINDYKAQQALLPTEETGSVKNFEGTEASLSVESNVSALPVSSSENSEPSLEVFVA